MILGPGRVRLIGPYHTRTGRVYGQTAHRCAWWPWWSICRMAGTIPPSPEAEQGDAMKKLLILLILVALGVAVARRVREA